MNSRKLTDWVTNGPSVPAMFGCGCNSVMLLVLTLSVVSAGFSYAATIDVTAYGANGNDIADDTPAIQSAVKALSTKDTFLFPQCSNYYKVRDDANFAIARDGVRIVIRGRIKSTGTPASGDNIFHVTADGIRFVGEGAGAIIEGSDEYMLKIDDPTGPCLIRFSDPHRCSVRNLTLRNGPHFFVCIWGGSDNEVVNCLFEGGPAGVNGKPISSSQVHAIYITRTLNCLIKGNRFGVYDVEGRACQWVGGSSAGSYISIIDNVFGRSHDHSVYCTGLHHSLVANNTSRNSHGCALKTVGTDNVIINNYIQNSRGGGIEIRNGSRNIVAGNVIDGFGFVGIEVSTYGGGKGDYRDNIIKGNFLRGLSNSLDGIRISTTSGMASGNQIINNVLIKTGQEKNASPIAVRSSSPCREVTIKGNVIDGCSGIGIVLSRVNNSLVSDNVIRIPAGNEHIQQLNGSSNNTLADNILSTY